MEEIWTRHLHSTLFSIFWTLYYHNSPEPPYRFDFTMKVPTEKWRQRKVPKYPSDGEHGKALTLTYILEGTLNSVKHNVDPIDGEFANTHPMLKEIIERICKLKYIQAQYLHAARLAERESTRIYLQDQCYKMTEILPKIFRLSQNTSTGARES